MEAAGTAVPSDDLAAVLAVGDGDVTTAVLSLSGADPAGRDDAYLEWHLLDHLPEQHRLPGLRHGQRWRSTPACRAERSASAPELDAVEHVVQYLFAGPPHQVLPPFVALGGALRAGGRLPHLLPRVLTGPWAVAGRRAAPEALVGAAVLPWRPARGAYLVVERADGPAAVPLGALVGCPGVAGAWRLTGLPSTGPPLDGTEGLTTTVCYLDREPAAVARALRPVLADLVGTGHELLLAAPFEAVLPWGWAEGG